MSTNPLDAAIEDLRVEMERNTTVGGAAIAFIHGVPDMIQKAVDEALAAGATPEQLEALSHLKQQMIDETTALESALTANTPEDPNNPASRRRP